MHKYCLIFTKPGAHLLASPQLVARAIARSSAPSRKLTSFSEATDAAAAADSVEAARVAANCGVRYLTRGKRAERRRGGEQGHEI